jgi:uncharacterized protein YqjF (DUF2071 family)
MEFLSKAAFRRPRGWVGAMNWENLLFMHWPLPPGLLEPLLPKGLTLDTFEGEAWIGVVPFLMTGVRPRFLPGLPGLSRFPELNVRTYVTRGGIPGVWFFSLDAANPMAVRGARKLFHLPYFDAEMGVTSVERGFRYASRRTHAGAPEAELRVSYAPVGRVYRAVPGSLEDWLTARFFLYAADEAGGLYRCAIHHHPWRLQAATAEVEINTMTKQLGIELPKREPLLHFAARTEVVGWMPKKIQV